LKRKNKSTKKKYVSIFKRKSSSKRTLMYLSISLLIIIISYSLTNNSNNIVTPVSINSLQTNYDKNNSSPLAPITFSGKGFFVTDKFYLEKGLSVFNVTHTGDGVISVILVDKDSRLIDFIDVFGGLYPLGVYSGQYMLNIDAPANDNWTVEVTQPRQDSIDMIGGLSGSGSIISKLFTLKDGSTKFNITSTGGFFKVDLKNEDGSRVETLVFSETGEFSGSTTVLTHASSTYLLDIQAEGDWTITIE